MKFLSTFFVLMLATTAFGEEIKVLKPGELYTAKFEGEKLICSSQNVDIPTGSLQTATRKVCESGGTYECYRWKTEEISGKYCKTGKKCQSGGTYECYYWETLAECGNQSCQVTENCQSGGTYECYYQQIIPSCQ